MITKTVGNMQTFANYASFKQFMQFSYQVLYSEFTCSLLGFIHKDKYLEWVLFSDEGVTFQMSGLVNPFIMVKSESCGVCSCMIW